MPSGAADCAAQPMVRSLVPQGHVVIAGEIGALRWPLHEQFAHDSGVFLVLIAEELLHTM